MQANVTEIASNVFRISTFHPEFGIQFNQFLVADEEPFIMPVCMLAALLKATIGKGVESL
jgi:hypothetical protein